ncbi:MAG: hypothetical protein OXD32_07925, partial [Endozoicomonadaceae bacterium]|nr:hypothetical protein [Endozoicomonadaceae bacterium]
DEDSADVDEETTIQMEPPCITYHQKKKLPRSGHGVRNAYANYKAYLSSPDDMSVHEQQWQEPDLNLLYNKTDVLDRGIYFTVMHRKIKKNFELLAGDLMRVVAVKHNVPFKLFSDHYIIPDELKPVCESYYQQIEKLGEHSGSVKVSQEKERLLFCHYIHCSDSWNTQLIFFYPNKPHLVDGRRIRYCYENKPQKNYPVQMF